MENKTKAIIYNRTSTKDQNPELQLDDCLNFCKEKDLEVIEVINEQGSAFKNKQRSEWERCLKLCKDNKYHLVLWRYDRAFRNREEFFKFMKVMFEVYSIKVYSVKELSIMLMWEIQDKINVPDPSMNEFMKGFMKLIWELQIKQAGEQAEEESKKKSDRVKLAVRKEEGKPTKSYKGNVWGRKCLSQNVIDQVLKLHQEGKSIRQITKEVYYWDKNNNKRNLSVAGVHKLISKNSVNTLIVNDSVNYLVNQYNMKKNYEIRIKVSKEELDIIKNKAQQLGMTTSHFLRSLGLKANLQIIQS